MRKNIVAVKQDAHRVHKTNTHDLFRVRFEPGTSRCNSFEVNDYTTGATGAKRHRYRMAFHVRYCSAALEHAVWILQTQRTLRAAEMTRSRRLHVFACVLARRVVVTLRRGIEIMTQ